MENCKRLYADTLAFYRRELSGPVFTAGWAFAGIAVLSFAFSLLSPTRADAVIAYYAQMLGQSGVADEGGNIQFFALLMNNLVAMALSLVYGLIPFLRLPALTLGTNGAIGSTYNIIGHWACSPATICGKTSPCSNACWASCPMASSS